MESKPRKKVQKKPVKKSAKKPIFELPPTSDVVFQYLFSSQGAEEGLVGFINAVNLSAGRPLIKEAEIKNPFNLADFYGDKMTVVDVKVKDEKGSFYDIEMQLMPGQSFANRVLYYWSQIYSTQISESQHYTKLRPVVSIVLTRFELFPQLSQMHNVFTLRSEMDPSVVFTDHAEIHTLELTDRKLAPVFSEMKEVSEKDEPLRNWIDYLLNANQKTEVEMDKLLTQTPGLERTHRIYSRFTRDERLRERALAREKAIRDEADHLEFAIQKGLLLGRTEGRAEGRAEGRVEGKLEAKVEAVSMILESKFPEFTDLERERLQKVTDLKRLDELMRAALSVSSYSEIASLF
ncbi:MAG: Rpn family recombination-promoting nuclease/putative transposase [Thermoguttaceae bacterium]|nr:Rpn family recombination-promoting nuclease/putative transposase [Thermoguttaceae bacterium]